jgi:hypothetical protein
VVERDPVKQVRMAAGKEISDYYGQKRRETA